VNVKKKLGSSQLGPEVAVGHASDGYSSQLIDAEMRVSAEGDNQEAQDQ